MRDKNPSNPNRANRHRRSSHDAGARRLDAWQLPLLRALAAEVFEAGTLRPAASSFCEHWITHVRSAQDRAALEALIPEDAAQTAGKSPTVSKRSNVKPVKSQARPRPSSLLCPMAHVLEF